MFNKFINFKDKVYKLKSIPIFYKKGDQLLIKTTEVVQMNRRGVEFISIEEFLKEVEEE